MHLEKKAVEQRERDDRLANFDKATDAWKKSAAREDLPRCSFCISAGLEQEAIGHSVTDSNGIVTCPVLIKRNQARSKRKALAIYSTADVDDGLNLSMAGAGNESDANTRREASLDRVEYFVDELPPDAVPEVYDPYKKNDD